MHESVVGRNSDLFIQGQKIHVQTEDWGTEQKVLMCRVFKNVSVFKTFKLAYEKIDKCELETHRKRALDKLHQTVIDWSYTDI